MKKHPFVIIGLLLLIFLIPSITSADGCGDSDAVYSYIISTSGTTWEKNSVSDFGQDCTLNNNGDRFRILETFAGANEAQNNFESQDVFVTFLDGYKDSLLTGTPTGECTYSSKHHFSDTDGHGFIIGGFLFVSKQTSIKFGVKAGCWEGSDIGGEKRVRAEYNILKVELTDLNDGVLSDINFSEGNYYGGQSFKTCQGESTNYQIEDIEAIPFYPGVYYVAYGVDLDDENNNDDCAKLKSHIYSGSSFEADGNQFSYIDNDKAFFSPYLLTGSELESIVDPSLFDSNKDFCELAGYTYSSIPSTNNCCGDDDYDIGFVEGDVVCLEDGWIELSDDYGWEEFCSYLGELAEQEPDFLLETAEIINMSFEEMRDEPTGLDSCCGDDPTPVCVNKYGSCAEVPAPGEACSDYGCQKTGQREDKDVSCSYFYEEEDPSWCPNVCTTNTCCVGNSESCVGHACALDVNGNCPSDCYEHVSSCTGSFNCQDYFASGYCVWEYGTPPCQGDIFDCSNLDEDACITDDRCEFKEKTDNQYVYDQYFCNKDGGANSEAGLFYSGVHDDLSWRWWNAKDASSAYLIHTLASHDYISNLNSWYYCNATSSTSSDDSIGELDSFDYNMEDLIGVCGSPKLQYLDYLEVDGNKYFNFVVHDSQLFSEVIDADNDEDLDNKYHDYVTIDLDVEAGSDLYNELMDSFFIGSCYRSGVNIESSEVTADFFKTDCDNLICDFDFIFAESVEIVVDDENTADNSYVRKDSFVNPDPIYVSESCENIGSFTGVFTDVCKPDEVCVALDGSASALITDEGLCCVGGVCRVPTAITCDDIGGFVMPSDDTIVQCLGEPESDVLIATSDTDNCCLTALYFPSEDDMSSMYTVNESFICYESFGGRSAFGECCSGTNCKNLVSWLSEGHSEGGMGSDNGRVFTTGSQLRTVESFDAISDGSFVDFIINRSFTSSDPYKVLFPSSFNQYDSAVSDSSLWNDYDSLSFDILYYGKYDLHSLILKSGDDEQFSINLSDKAIIMPLNINDDREILPRHMWHHITIPFVEELETFVDDNQIAEYTFNFTLPASAEVGSYFGDETVVFMDNFVLRDDDLTDEYYCAGDYGVWLEDLQVDDEDGSGFAGDSLKEFLPEKAACNAQMSFGWTGTRCCGYESTKADPTDYSTAEYYIDSSRACWGGITLSDNTIIPQAYGGNLDAWPHILYKEVDGVKAFWSCNESMSIPTDTITGDDIDLRTVQPFSILGSWYCDPDKTWHELDDINKVKVKVLATKLYGMAGDDYVLHCDDFDASAFELLNSTSLASISSSLGTSESALTACVLKNITGDDPEDVQVFVGLPLDESMTVDAFIDSLFKSYYPMNASEESKPSCNFTSYGNPFPDSVTLSDEDAFSSFFTECLGSGDAGLNVYYNKPLKLLVLSSDDPYEEGFFVSMWTAIRNFFANLFVDLQSDQVGAQPLIPLDIDYQANLSRLYLASQDDVAVRGVVESDIENNWFVRVDYLNFSADVSPLVAGYHALGFPETQARVCSKNSNQTIFINFHEDDSFAESFDWRYLTSGLRLTNIGDPGDFETDPACWLHNGHIDLDEECDDTYDNLRVPVVPNDDSIWCTVEKDMKKECSNGKLVDGSCSVTKYVLFSTSDAYDGNLGGLPGGDVKCQVAAEDGDFVKVVSESETSHTESAMAVLSVPGVHARDRFIYRDVPVYKMTGDEIAVNVSELFLGSGSGYSNNKNSFLYDEYGDEITFSQFWTGSTRLGLADSDTCSAWSSTDGTGQYGTTEQSIPGRWLSANYAVCSADKQLHCLMPIGSSS